MNISSLERSRTKFGVICGIYRRQKRNSKARGHKPPQYTKQELINWANSQDAFHSLYDNWVKSGYKKPLKPSIDRISDYDSYRFENIQLMTWDSNNRKAHRDMVNGVNNKQSKPIKQLSINGESINEYYSLMKACRETGIDFRNISRAALDGKTAGGFKWQYA